MKILAFALGIVLSLLLYAHSGSAVECGPTPTDHCIISQSTTFTPGNYQTENISIVGNNIDVDCNGAVFNHVDSILFNVAGTTRVTIHNCHASAYGRVITNEPPGDVTLQVPVEELTIRDNEFTSLPSIAISLNNLVTYTGNYHLNNAYPNLQIINNTLTGTGSGVYITKINNTLITDNYFEINGAPNYEGIFIIGSSNVLIERNTLIGGKINAVHLGSGVIRTENMTIQYNTISDVYRGIELNEGTDGTVIENNYFNRDGVGIHVKSNRNNISLNTFVGDPLVLDGSSTSGVYLEQSASPQENQIFLNVFENITDPNFDGGSNNNWHAVIDDGFSTRDLGNYYSKYHEDTQTVRGNTCTDVNTDNICDYPLIFDTNLSQDPRPLRSSSMQGAQNNVFGQPPLVDPIADIAIREVDPALVFINATSPLGLELHYAIKTLQGRVDPRFIPVPGRPNEFVWDTGLFDAGNFTFLAVAIDERDMNTGERFKISVSQSPQGCQNYLPRLVDGCDVETNVTFGPGTYFAPRGLNVTADNVYIDCNGAVLQADRERTGITILNRQGVTVSNCVLENYNQGIVIQNSNTVQVLDSRISNSLNDGIRAIASQNLLLQDNILYRNQFAIHFDATDDSMIVHNFLEENKNEQISIFSSSRNTVTENTVLNPTTNSPIVVGPATAQNNIIYHNNFINYLREPFDSGTNTAWSLNNEGNYWSRHICTDANWDGICDNAYSFAFNGRDDYPFVRANAWKYPYPQMTVNNPTPNVGTPVTFSIVDPDMANKPYFILLDLANTPSIQMSDGRLINLIGSGLFFASLVDPASFGLVSSGSFDANGVATVTWNIPPLSFLHGIPFWLTIIPYDTTYEFPQMILSTYRSAGVVPQ